MPTVEFQGPISWADALHAGVRIEVDPGAEHSVDVGFDNGCGPGASTTQWTCAGDAVIVGGTLTIQADAGFSNFISKGQGVLGLVGGVSVVDIIVDVASIDAGSNVDIYPDDSAQAGPPITTTGQTIFSDVLVGSDTTSFVVYNSGTAGQVVISSMSIRSAPRKEFTVNGTLETSPSDLLSYTGTWDVAPAPGDVITYTYDPVLGDYQDENGRYIKALTSTMENCLNVPPFTGGISISFNGALMYPNSGFSLQQNLMYIAGV